MFTKKLKLTSDSITSKLINLGNSFINFFKNDNMKLSKTSKLSEYKSENKIEYDKRNHQNLFFDIFKKDNNLCGNIITTSSKRLLSSKYRTYLLNKFKKINTPIKLNGEHSLISPNSRLGNCLNVIQERIMTIYEDINLVKKDLEFIKDGETAIKQISKEIKILKQEQKRLESNETLCLESSQRGNLHVPWYGMLDLGFNKAGVNTMWASVSITPKSKIKKVNITGKNMGVRSWDTSSIFDYECIKLGLDNTFYEDSPEWLKVLNNSVLKELGIWVIPKARTDNFVGCYLYSKKNELKSTIREIALLKVKIRNKTNSLEEKESDNKEKDPENLINELLPNLYYKMLNSAKGKFPNNIKVFRTLEEAMDYSKRKIDMLKFWSKVIYYKESRSHTDYEKILKVCDNLERILSDIENNNFKIQDRLKNNF